MKRASYREAIAWIAWNDDLGSNDSLNATACAEMISCCLVADLFGVPAARVGGDVVAYRVKEKACEPPALEGRRP